MRFISTNHCSLAKTYTYNRVSITDDRHNDSHWLSISIYRLHDLWSVSLVTYIKVYFLCPWLISGLLENDQERAEQKIFSMCSTVTGILSKMYRHIYFFRSILIDIIQIWRYYKNIFSAFVLCSTVRYRLILKKIDSTICCCVCLFLEIAVMFFLQYIFITKTYRT